MLNLKKGNTRFLLIAAGITVSALGGFGWLTWSDLKRIDELGEETEGLEGKIRTAEGKIRTTAAVENRVLILREQIKESVTILPDDAEIHAFVDKLTQFERDSGVVVTKLDDTQARERGKKRGKKAAKAFESITYKLAIKGTTPQLLGFVDLLENEYDRFVRIPSFKITAFDERIDPANGPVDPTSVLRQHVVALDLETFAYNPKKAGHDLVKIKNEAKKIEDLLESGLLEADNGDVQVVRFDLKETPGRRDPFVDPRIFLAVNSPISEAQRRHQLQVLSGLKTRIREISEAIAKEEEIENTVKRMQVVEQNNRILTGLATEVGKLAEDEKFFSVVDYAKEFHALVQTPLEGLMARLNRIDTEAIVQSRDVEHRVAQMQAAVGNKNWGLIIELHDEIQKLRERFETPPELAPMLAKADQMHRQASAHRGFDAMKFKFGGCVTYEDDPQHAVIIINGRSFGPTELVAEGLVIKSITPTEVVFDYEGYRVSRRHAAMR
ncbi:MAG: hypothetical protein CMJ83_05845 [Planctomycetes bacterium]|nr:hypothetical protein [Planctomycetota bacterium]